MNNANKRYFYDLLRRCAGWDAGDSETFNFGDWTLVLQKESTTYLPHTFALLGEKNGSNETWARRYVSAQAAILHVCNRFNENANIQNRYASLEDFYTQV